MSFHRAQAIAAGALLFASFYFGYLFHMTGVGLLGPDEPRYASIAREMAESGDWITPRLWGEPWFEKPPFLYWLTALGFKLKLPQDAAPRVGVAIMSAAFLALYWRSLARRVGSQAAWFSTLILGTTAGWIAFSQVGATDLPLAATFGAAMLLAFEGLEESRPSALRWAGVCFGLSVLAKGLVGLVLALPLVWFGWRRWRQFVVPVCLGLAVAAPWYLLMLARYGRVFFDDFFLKHHLARFNDLSIAHGQPWWFYIPVLIGGLFPWFPLTVLVRRSTVDSHFGKFLLAWLGFGMLFFSVATNKLPGYLLPLLPAAAGLLGIALDRARRAPLALGSCVLVLSGLTAIAGLLPQALLDGLSRATWGEIPLDYVAVLAILAAGVWFLEREGFRLTAVAATALLVIAGVVYLKLSIYPVLDRLVSARTLWVDIAPRASDACVESLSRDDRYGLNYYSRTPLPDCDSADRPIRVSRKR